MSAVATPAPTTAALRRSRGLPSRRPLECHRRVDADKTVATLDGLVAEGGTAPGYVRCDNGPS
jgi:hypothetical protein